MLTGVDDFSVVNGIKMLVHNTQIIYIYKKLQE